MGQRAVLVGRNESGKSNLLLALRTLIETRVTPDTFIVGHNVAHFDLPKLRQFIEMAAACKLFLTNDSGAMHVASALGVPTVAVFGATDHVATSPRGPVTRIVREPVDCAPCKLRECPIDHRCMTRVPAERVAEVALELLRL